MNRHVDIQTVAVCLKSSRRNKRCQEVDARAAEGEESKEAPGRHI